MNDDWSCWVVSPTTGVWHQVVDSEPGQYAVTACGLRVSGLLMDYRAAPTTVGQRKCGHQACQRPGDERWPSS